MDRKIVDRPEYIDDVRVVNDYEEILKAMENGETIMHFEWGDSLYPILQNGEYCKITPLNDKVKVNVGDPVFCHFVYPLTDGGTGDFYMVHRCTDMYKRGDVTYYKIESTDNQFYGWTKDVYGVAESTNVFQDEKILWE